MEIARLGQGDEDRVVKASRLFDNLSDQDLAADFLRRDGHHLLVASMDGVDVGFVSGIEMAHPDKPAEMLLYELGVDEPYRRRGVGRALTLALVELARERGCRGVWLLTEAHNEAAISTYRSAGASEPQQGVTLEWRFT